MALSFSIVVPPQPFGARRMAIVDVTFDSSYPTGGEAVTADDFGLSQVIDTMLPALAKDSGGVVIGFAYDPTNKKIFAYYPTGGSATAPTTVAQPVGVAPTATLANAVIPSGGTAVTSTAAQPALTITQPTISAPAITPGGGKEVGNTANLSGYVVRFIAFGL